MLSRMYNLLFVNIDPFISRNRQKMDTFTCSKVNILSYFCITESVYYSGRSKSNEQLVTEQISASRTLEIRVYLSLIYLIQAFLSGVIMLLYMTFNMWVFISLSLGMTFSYFIFESKNDLGHHAGHAGHHF